MKSLIFLELLNLILALQFIDFNKKCVCSDQHMAADCTGSCFWENNSCRDKTCADYTQTECSFQITCKWGTSCKDYTPVCSDYKTEQDCDYLSSKYNCAWKDPACKPFTKCKDYIPGKTGCSSKSGLTQRCRTNTAQTACEDYIPTITTCSSFTTSDSCYYSDAGYCIWDTTCNALIGCGQIKQYNSCLKQSRYCKFDSKCQDKTCADNTSLETCTYVKQLYSTIGTLCKWDETTKKCADAADTSALTSANCRKNTAYTYVWDGTKCRQCTGPSGSNSFDLIRASFNGSVVLGMIVSLWMIQF